MAIHLHQLLKQLTVEPALFFYYSTHLILDLVNTNLYIQKACRFNTTIEPDLDTECDNQKQGILLASEINSKYKYVTATIAILYSILITCWSDEAGKRRRPLIFLPIIGQIFKSMNGCLHSYFWIWPPILAALMDMFTELLTGGVVLWLVACQIYICDVSTADNRTMRLGFLIAIRTVCIPISNGSSGFLIRGVGFFYAYFLCFLLSLVAFMLVLIFVKDVSVPVKHQRFYEFFNFKRILQCFKIVFKKSLGTKKHIVFMLLTIHVVIDFTVNGEKTVFYLFLKHRFHWDEIKYGIYVSYQNTGVILGTLFCSLILSKWMKMHDGFIGVFASFWDTIAVIGYLFASTDWHLYVVPIFDIFQGTALAVSVSFLSKFYESSEFGRLNSVLMVFSLLIPFCHLAYSIVFQKTLDFFPSAFFLISIFLNLFVFGVYSATYLICKKKRIR